MAKSFWFWLGMLMMSTVAEFVILDKTWWHIFIATPFGGLAFIYTTKLLNRLFSLGR